MHFSGFHITPEFSEKLGEGLRQEWECWPILKVTKNVSRDFNNYVHGGEHVEMKHQVAKKEPATLLVKRAKQTLPATYESSSSQGSSQGSDPDYVPETKRKLAGRTQPRRPLRMQREMKKQKSGVLAICPNASTQSVEAKTMPTITKTPLYNEIKTGMG